MIFWRNACIAWALFVAFAAQAANVGVASVALPVLVPQRVAPHI